MITARNTRWDLSDSRREGTSFPAPRPCLPPAAAAQLPASGCQHHSGPSEIHRWILIWVQNPAESTQLGCITDICCTCVFGKALYAFLVTSCSSCTPAAPSTYTWTRRATNHAREPQTMPGNQAFLDQEQEDPACLSQEFLESTKPFLPPPQALFSATRCSKRRGQTRSHLQLLRSPLLAPATNAQRWLQLRTAPPAPSAFLFAGRLRSGSASLIRRIPSSGTRWNFKPTARCHLLPEPSVPRLEPQPGWGHQARVVQAHSPLPSTSTQPTFGF